MNAFITNKMSRTAMGCSYMRGLETCVVVANMHTLDMYTYTYMCSQSKPSSHPSIGRNAIKVPSHTLHVDLCICLWHTTLFQMYWRNQCRKSALVQSLHVHWCLDCCTVCSASIPVHSNHSHLDHICSNLRWSNPRTWGAQTLHTTRDGSMNGVSAQCSWNHRITWPCFYILADTNMCCVIVNLI